MKEKSFAQELAALINRHGIDAKMNTNDWILADVAIDALNAYGKANQLREKNGKRPGTGERRLRLPGVYIAPSLTRESPTRRERIQKTGGVRRTKRSGSNGGVLC